MRRGKKREEEKSARRAEVEINNNNREERRGERGAHLEPGANRRIGGGPGGSRSGERGVEIGGVGDGDGDGNRDRGCGAGRGGEEGRRAQRHHRQLPRQDRAWLRYLSHHPRIRALHLSRR